MKPIYFVLFAVAVQLLATSFPISGQGMAQANTLTAEQDARNRMNFAGRQRMLTQKIARDACFVMAGIDPMRFAAKKEATVRQFSTALTGLRDGDAHLGLFPERNSEVLEQLEHVEGIWATLGPASRQIATGDLHSVPMNQLVTLNVVASSVA